MESPELSTPYSEPNHVGIIRCAIEVDDVDASYEILKNSTWAKDHSIIFGPPEGWDLGPQWGTHKVLNFKDPEGKDYCLIPHFQAFYIVPYIKLTTSLTTNRSRLSAHSAEIISPRSDASLRPRRRTLVEIVIA